MMVVLLLVVVVLLYSMPGLTEYIQRVSRLFMLHKIRNTVDRFAIKRGAPGLPVIAW